MDSDEQTINRMPVAEFREFGYLQELNRRFLHPLGLALEVEVAEDGTESFGGVWDYRDDPEGMRYGDGGIDPAKYARVEQSWATRLGARGRWLNYMIQPVPGTDDDPPVAPV